MKQRGIGSHQQSIGREQEWLTPVKIIQALGPFDLDPCAPVNRPWDTAMNYYTKYDDGLIQRWYGRVWLNPPYHRYLIGKWMERLAMHGNGIALVFARTETQFFQDYIFPYADSMLFINGRLTFHKPDGVQAKFNGGAPSVLIAYGMDNVDALQQSGIPGKHVAVNYVPVVVVGVSPSWFSVVSIAVKSYGNDSLQPIYDMVERIAPDKVAKNRHWKEKIRQQVYRIKSKISN